MPLYERTLADQTHVLGPDHPDTMTTRDGLALAYVFAGRLAPAVPLLEEALARRARLLGENHPRTVLTRTAPARTVENLAR